MRVKVTIAVGVAVVAILAAAAAAMAVRTQTQITSAPDQGALSIELEEYGPLLERCFNTTVTPQPRASECVLNLTKQATAAGRYGSAMAIMRDSTQRTYDMVGRCHNALHEIGWAMLEAGMPLSEVYAVPFPDCRFGLYHGALNAHIKPLDIEQLRTAMPSLCTPFGDPNTNATQECVHVLGHFVVDRIGTDLAASLEACTVFAEPALQARCSDGVFMQAVDLSRSSAPETTETDIAPEERIARTWGTTREEQQSKATGVCDTATVPEVRYVCFTAVSQTLAVLWEKDYAAVGDVCINVAPDGKQPCFEGVAASAFTLLDWNPEAIAGACHAVQDEATQYCMGSLAFTMGLQDTAGKAGNVCELALEHEKSVCTEGYERGRAVYNDMQNTTSTTQQETEPGPDQL